CARMKPVSWRLGSTLGSIRYWMFGRSKLATNCAASGRRRRSVISRWVSRVAVAVSAMRGTPGNCSPRSPRASYSRRTSCPRRAPLRQAGGLGERDDAQPSSLEESRGGGGRQALGGDVEQVELAGEERPLDRGPLRRRLRRVQVGRAHAVGQQSVDLIMHQRDE